jgi:hypothetical protein
MEVIKWRKSSRSGATGGECVELASFPDLIAIRDSKNPHGPMLALDRADFGAFLARVKQH